MLNEFRDGLEQCRWHVVDTCMLSTILGAFVDQSFRIRSHFQFRPLVSRDIPRGRRSGSILVVYQSATAVECLGGIYVFRLGSKLSNWSVSQSGITYAAFGSVRPSAMA